LGTLATFTLYHSGETNDTQVGMGAETGEGAKSHISDSLALAQCLAHSGHSGNIAPNATNRFLHHQIWVDSLEKSLHLVTYAPPVQCG
jgi:hypothetical protein